MAACKRCLLYEAGERKIFETVSEYISNLDDDLKVNHCIYSERLNHCKHCDNLISGMCLKCGCYVEIRAILKDKSCPDFDNRKW